MRLRGEVGQLRQENANLKMAATSKGTEPAPANDLAIEVAQHKLRFAEEMLKETEARFKAGLATATEHDQAQFAREIAEAGFRQDGDQVRQLKLERADKILSGAEEKYSSGQITGEEFARAQLERDVAVAELNNNPAEVARLKLEAAEASMKLVEARQKIGKATQPEYLRARLDRDRAASEYAGRVKISEAK